MAKSRVTVNDEEALLVEQARDLSKLQAKRRRDADALADLDTQIAGLKASLGKSLGTTEEK